MNASTAMRGRNDAQQSTSLRRRLLPALIAGCFAGSVIANPLGPQVVNGQVGFSNQGNVLSVTNSPGSIINWQSFSINPGEITRFIQQNPNSAVLNRIIGQDPSQILGALQSNGRVFLINPNGILFGQGSQVDVKGLIASTLNVSNEDFLSGKWNFNAGDKAGNVKNQGTITTPGGGQVFLIAPNVENSGIITSPKGDVLLAAGRSVQLVDSMNPDLHVVISAPENEALNLGQVIAQGGKTGIYGALVKQRGIVNANSAVVGEDGKVVLKASRDTLLESGSRTTATGAGKGGEIHVLGERVGLTGDAQVDASGRTGGGTVLVGGDYQGRNAQIQNAKRTYVGPETQIRVDAMESGDGGKAIVWAEEITRAHGTISARGGQQGGNGGMVETSAHSLDVNGVRVDASASKGQNGTWLLDPVDVTVQTTGIGAAAGDVDVFADAGASLTIDPSTLDGAGANVVIQAQNDITVSNSINLTTTSNANLTLQAGGSISVGAASSLATNGTGNITLVANNVGNTETDAAGAALMGSGGTNRAAGAATISLLGPVTTTSGKIKIVNSAETASGGTPGSVYIQGALTTGGNVSIAGSGVTFDALGDVSAADISINGRTGTISGTLPVVVLQSSSGAVTLQADNIDPINFSINATAAGTVKIAPYSSGRRIDVGTAFASANCSGTACLKFTWTDLNAALASVGTVVIGDPVTTGDLYVTDDIATARNLTLEAGGSITWNTGKKLDYNGSGGAAGKTLTLQANSNVAFDGMIYDSAAPGTDKLNVIFNANRASGGGAIGLNGADIATNGGAITLGGGNDPMVNPATGTAAKPDGIAITGNSILSAGAGRITVVGAGYGGTNYASGVRVENGTLSTTTGDIEVVGTGGAGVEYNSGVNLGVSSMVSTVSGNLTIQGTGGASVSPNLGNSGVVMSNGAVVKSTGTGAPGQITIVGQGANSSSSPGINIMSGSKVETVDANVAMSGQGNSTSYSDGVYIQSSGIAGPATEIKSTGLGTLSITGAVGVNNGNGIVISGSANADVLISSDTSNITLTGTGRGTGTAGVKIAIPRASGASSGVASNSGHITISGSRPLNSGTALDFNDASTGTGTWQLGGPSAILTLSAGGDVSQTAGIIDTDQLELTGTGNFSLPNANAINYVAANVTGNVSLGAGAFTIGSVDGTDGITASGGSVKLSTSGVVTQTKPITATSLELLATGSGEYTLTGANSVGTLAASVPNALTFTNSGALTVGSVGSTNGVATTAANQNIALTSTGSSITVNDTSATDDISATGTVTLQSAGNFSTAGGSSVKGTRVAISTMGGGNINLGGNVTSTETGSGAGIATLQVAIGSATNHTIATSGTLTAASGRIDITGQGGSVTVNGPITQQSTLGAVKIASQDAVSGGGTISGTGLITSNAIDLQNVAGVTGTRVIGPLNTASIDATGTTFKIGNTTPGEVTSLSINHTGNATFPGASFFVKTNSPVDIQATGNLSVSAIDSGTSNLTLKSTTGTLTATGALFGNNVNLTSYGNFTPGDSVTAGNSVVIDLTNAEAKLTVPGGFTVGGVNSTTIKADKMDFNAASSVGIGGSTVTLLPKSANRPIVLGTSTPDPNGLLELSTAELNRVAANTLQIGDTTSGALSVDAAIAPSGVSTLALHSGGTITQTGAITSTNLAVKALEDVTLLNTSNNVTNLAAYIGDGTHKNKNFLFHNGVNPLNIHNSIASTSGITLELDLSGYVPGSPDGVIALTTSGILTQSDGGTLGGIDGGLLRGKAVYAQGQRVILTESNPTGVIAGKAMGAATGDAFKYTTSGPIWLTTVNGVSGIDVPNTPEPISVALTTSASGISQDSAAKITAISGLVLSTPGAISMLGADNNVASLSATGATSIGFRNVGPMTLGVSGSGISTSNGTVNIYADGLLTVKNNVSAGTGNVSLEGQNVQIGVATAAGISISGGVVGIRADAAGTGTISTDGTSASTINSSKGIAIEADNLDFSLRAPTLTATNEIAYRTYSDNRSITVGTACNAADINCLKITGMTNSAPDLVIGVGAVTDSNTAGNIHVDAPLTNAGGRIALLTGGGIDQSGTGVITAGTFGFKTGSSGVSLGLANSIGNVAGITQGGAVSITNTPALNVVQVTAGDPLYSDITVVNGITTNNGNVTLTNTGAIGLNAPISAGTGTVSLTTNNAISGTGNIIANTFNASAGSGIGHATALSTVVSNLSATNSGNNTNINITNSGNLFVSSATQTDSSGTGGISITNYGDLSVNTVSTYGGPINLNAYHKMTVSGAVSSTSGAISLSAAGTGTAGNNDDLVINGSVTSTSGNITLSAGDYITILNPTNVSTGTGTLVTNDHQNGPIPVTTPEPTAPTVADCTANPSLSGCSTVLPSLASCTTDPSQAGCTAVLPSLDSCTADPTKAGCTAVLPTIDKCIATPTLSGCATVLPTLTSCTANPTQAGCTAVLPSMDACIANPAQSGCTAVLPTLSTCTTNPTQAGCTAVLPSMISCTTNPTQAGCTAVLPSLASCTTDPTLSGCTAVLPSLSSCTTNPTQAGCTAVLPSLSSCTTNPTQTGCTAVLPSLTSCTTNPSQAGCTAVLPSLTSCTTNPTQAGCTAVLPSLTSCTTNPTQAGCTAVLPTLTSCTTNPTQAGCSAVLPSVELCLASPATAGCSAVPTMSSCTVNPKLAGCSTVLPSIESCTLNSTQPGCSVVLPTVDQCLTTSTLPGCSVVLTATSRCLRDPSLPECKPVTTNTPTTPEPVVTPPADNPVLAVEKIVVTYTSQPDTTPIASVTTQPSGSSSSTSTSSSASSSASSSSASSASSPSAKPDDQSSDKKDEKKEEKKTTSGPEDSGAKKNEAAKKLYCN